MNKWQEANQWESQWWGNGSNTFQEEKKQISYAQRMGLTIESRDGRYPVIDFHNQTVIDFGGGMVSLLLKGINVKGTVIDPCEYPKWTYDRYESAGITAIKVKAEDYCIGKYDVGLIYNVLQHVENPKKVIENMVKICDMIYIHEWIDTPISAGHIHTIKEKDLNEWLDGTGLIGYERWSDKVSTPYYTGIFI